jgi:hypothetical protein
MIDARRRMRDYFHRLRSKGRDLDAESGVSRGSGDKSNVDWGDIDRTEVPVLLVFVILLVRMINE